MAPSSIAESDPFQDPIVPTADHDFVGDSTLLVGRDASLTLATDSLIVLGRPTFAISDFSCDEAYDDVDEHLRRREAFNCCGLLPTGINALDCQASQHLTGASRL